MRLRRLIAQAVVVVGAGVSLTGAAAGSAGNAPVGRWLLQRMGAMPITCARETDPPHCKSSHARALHQLPDFLDVDVPNHDTAFVNKRRWSVTELSDDDGLVLETPANPFGWFALSVGVHNPQGVWGKLYYFEYDDHGSIACGDAREVVAR